MGEVGGFLEHNIGGIITDVGMVGMSIIDPAFAPFAAVGIASSVGGMVGSAIEDHKANDAAAAGNKTAEESVAAAKAQKAYTLRDLMNGSQSPELASRAAAMVAAIASGAPLSQAASAANVHKGLFIQNKALGAAAAKAIGGGLGGGAAKAAIHFGDPIQMRGRSWQNVGTNTRALRAQHASQQMASTVTSSNTPGLTGIANNQSIGGNSRTFNPSAYSSDAVRNQNQSANSLGAAAYSGRVTTQGGVITSQSGQ